MTVVYRTRRECVTAYAPLILWLAVILILGSSTGSMAETSRFIKPLIEFFFPSAPPETFLIVHAAIRKTAHFVEYGILALLASRAFLRSVSTDVRSRWALGAVGVVLATATIDEVNQSFLSMRTGSPRDVLLDVTGGVAAIVLVWLFRRRKRAEAAVSGR